MQSYLKITPACIFIIYSVGQSVAPNKDLIARDNFCLDSCFYDNRLNTSLKVRDGQFVNGLEFELSRVVRHSNNKDILIEMLVANPNRNSEVALSHAVAFDREGDEYSNEDRRSGPFFRKVIFAETTEKIGVVISGVPSGVDYLREFRFSVYNECTGQEVLMQFRNLDIVSYETP